MLNLFLIAFGGSLGALARYGLSGLVGKIFFNGFPYGTLAVNLIGSFFIGFLFGLSEKLLLHKNLNFFLAIGFLGAFTTFSTFSLETFNLFKNGELKLAFANIFVSHFLGILLVFSGIFLSKLFDWKMKKYFLVFYSDKPFVLVETSKNKLFRLCVEKISQELVCYKTVSFFPDETGDFAGEVTDYLEVDSCGNKTVVYYPNHHVSENPPQEKKFVSPEEAAAFYVEKYFQSRVFEFEED